MWMSESAGYDAFVADVLEGFQKTHPNVSVELEMLANEAYKTAIHVALTAADAPDVFFNRAGEDSARLARAGLALDIGELGLADGNFRTTLSEGWQNSFKFGDAIYGVPFKAVSKYFYYTKPCFAEHNLSVPATFDDLLGLCKQVRAIDPDTVPMPLGNSERWKLNHYITVINERTLGLDALAADYNLSAPKSELFTNAGYVDALNNVLKMQDAGCFQDAPNATSPESTRTMFAAEISPMIFCGTWCMGVFDDEGFTDYGLFRFPVINADVSDASTNMVVPEGFQVSTASEHPAEAVAWISHLVNAETSAEFAARFKDVPSNAALVGDIQATEQFKWVAGDMAALSAGFSVLDVLLEANVSEAYLDLGVEILNRTKTPEQAMEIIRATALESRAKMSQWPVWSRVDSSPGAGPPFTRQT